MSPRGLLFLRALVVLTGALPWALLLAPIHGHQVALAFRTLCHQLPERTLVVSGAPMVVCSRCAGVYAGVALGVLLPLRRRWLAHGRALFLASLSLGVLDVVTQDVGLHAPWHPVRLATGLAIGWTASAFMFGTLAVDPGRVTRRVSLARTG